MADKGRDLKVSVLSDADQFDLGKPADDLEQLADAADQAESKLSQLGQAGDELRTLGTDAQRAGADVKGLGTDADRAGADVKGLARDAQATAAKVDGAFDKIAAASKRSGDKVDKSMDKAGAALDEFKDEARQSGTEAAASFSGGFDDVTDFIQETVANGLGGLGKIGMAAGIAAAAGIGFIVSAAQAAQEKVSGIRQALVDLDSEGLNTTHDRVKAVLDEMRQTDTLARFAGAARDAGVDFGQYVEALAEGGPKAEAMRHQLEEMSGAWGGLATAWGEGKASHDLLNRLGDQERAAEGATTEIEALGSASVELAQQQSDTAEAVSTIAGSIESFSSAGSVYSTVLQDLTTKEHDRAQATADATKDSKDSWEDYAKSVSVSVDDYLAELQRQVEAQEGWAANMEKLARRGVSEGVLAELSKMGPQGAPLIAKLTTASDAELSKLGNLMQRKGADATEQLAGAINAGRPGVAGTVAEIREDARRQLAGGANLPVHVTPPPAGQAAAIRRDVQNNMQPVEIPVMLRNVPSSVMSRYVP